LPVNLAAGIAIRMYRKVPIQAGGEVDCKTRGAQPVRLPDR